MKIFKKGEIQLKSESFLKIQLKYNLKKNPNSNIKSKIDSIK